MQTITTKKEKLCNAFREDSTIIKLQSTISAMWLRGSVDNNKSNSNKNEVEFIFDSKKTERKKMELIVAARQRK